MVRIFLSVAVTLWIYVPTIAWACSPGWSLERHRPNESSTVPANTMFQWVGPMAPNEVTVEVAPLGQPLAPATVVEVPDQSAWALSNLLQVNLPTVAPGTTLRLVVSTPFLMGEEFLVTPGTGLDTTAPLLTGTLTLSGTHQPASNFGGSCVPAEHFRVNLSFPAATDNVEVANYTVYETTGTSQRPLSSFEVNSAVRQTATVFIPAQPYGQRCLTVIARDTAGNESAPLSSCAQLTAPAPDAGSMDGASTDPDAAPATADGGTTTGGSTGPDSATPPGSLNDSGTGCICAAGRKSSLHTPMLGGLALILLVGVRLRRRS